MSMFLAALVIGFTATLVMDLWSIFLKKFFEVIPPNWALVGRWVGHWRNGQIFHHDINEATPFLDEKLVGWVFHYFIGVAYALGFVYVAGIDWLNSPTFSPVLFFSVASICGGWFCLHPCMGFGWALAKTENPAIGRLLGLLSHVAFGLGMWLGIVIFYLLHPDQTIVFSFPPLY